MATAIVALEELSGTCGLPEMTPELTRKGLASVAWPARMEVLKRRPAVMIDGAGLAGIAGELAIGAAWCIGAFVTALTMFRWR